MFRGHHGHRGHHPHAHTHQAMRGRRQWGPFSVEWDMTGDAPQGGRGRRRMFSGDELRLVLLALIDQAPRHGYDLIREIEERTGGAYAPSPGVVYPTLTLLADMDHIAEQAAEGAKKLYAITPAGQAHLNDRAEEATRLLARLAELGTQREQSGRSPVRRAMGNLKMAVMQRLGSDTADQDMVNAIVDLIDETARKVERL